MPVVETAADVAVGKFEWTVKTVAADDSLCSVLLLMLKVVSLWSLFALLQGQSSSSTCIECNSRRQHLPAFSTLRYAYLWRSANQCLRQTSGELASLWQHALIALQQTVQETRVGVQLPEACSIGDASHRFDAHA